MNCKCCWDGGIYTPKVKSVFRFPNGMVATCDPHGQQIPTLQGPWERVCHQLAAWINKETELQGVTSEEMRRLGAFKLEEV